MTENKDQQKSNRDSRRTYERPKVIAREPLEAVATVCQPSPPAKSVGICVTGPISS